MGESMESSEINLWNSADKVTNIVTVKIEKEMDGKNVDLIHGKTTTKILSVNGIVKQEKELSDFYIIRQDFMLCPTDMLFDSWQEKGWYVGEYRITQQPSEGYEKSTELCQNTSPHGTVGATSVSASTSLSFGGSVGTFGLTGTTGLNAGYSVSDSTSFSISDVEVENRCHNIMEVAGWKFIMPRITEHKRLGDFHLTEPKNMSRNTFQPTIYTIWRCKNRAPDDMFEIVTKIEATLVRTRLKRGHSDFLYDLAAGLAVPPGLQPVAAILAGSNAIADAIACEAVHETIDVSMEFTTKVQCPPYALP